jgi:peptide/nickel transport system substrate-binding protein
MKKGMMNIVRSKGIATTTRRALLLAAPLLVGMAGLLPASVQAADTPLVIARAMDINSLDPARTWCDTCQIYVSNVYESLIGLAADNKTLTPRLATSWEASDDQKQLTFHLDPTAVFSDGSPVEAKDVKWSWERLHNIKGGPSFMMDGVKSIEVPDAHTVVVTMEAPNSEFLGILTAPYTGVINSDVAIANGANANADADQSDTSEPWFMANSAGSGPYVLAGYKADDELRLKANPNYKRSKVGISEIVIKETKDAVAQAQLLASGDADIAMQIDPDTAKTIQSDKVSISSVPSYNFVYVAISPGAKGNTVKLSKEVREAIGYALDYNGTVEFTVGGEGKLQSAPIPNGFPGTDGLPTPTQDVAKAKELLEKAGLGAGFEINAEFPNMNVYGVDLSLLMQKVQQDLAQVNIKVGLTPLEFSVWRDHVRGDGIPLTAVFYAPDYFGSAQYVQYFAMMEGTPWWKRAGGEKDPSVTNAREAELLKQALAAPEAAKDKLYHDIAMEMINDRVIIPLVSPNVVLAHGKAVKGVRYSACCNLPLDEITRE